MPKKAKGDSAMNEFFAGVSLSVQLVVFSCLAFGGFLFLLLTSVFSGGDDADAHFDHDVDGDADGDGDSGGDHSTVSFFSPKILAIFLLAFGASGAIATTQGASPVISTIVAIVGAAVVAVLALLMLRLMYSQQCNSLITNVNIAGSRGHVVTRIPLRGIGEVSLVVNQQSVTRLARSLKGSEIAIGRPVKVVSADGDTLLVEAV